MRSFLSLVIALSLAAPARRVAADDKQACIAASEKAQQLRADGKLSSSREQLLFCARDVCPGVVRKDCARWLGEVEEAMPSIVLGARDGEGHDVTGVKVSVDGKVFAEKLEGKAQSIDPGTHVVKFERDTGEVVTENVLIREGEKNRILAVTFGPAKPTDASAASPPKPSDSSPAARPPEAHSPVAAWVLSGVGVVALGSFAYFGITARNDASDLRGTCAPTCAESEVDSVRTRLLVADVSLGVSLLSFGLATYLFVSSNNEKRTAVVVQPLASGGALQLVGRF
jgi:hypothetical protein